MLKMESGRRPRDEWCRNHPTSRGRNVATSQCRDVAGKPQQTLSLREAIKGMGESH